MEEDTEECCPGSSRGRRSEQSIGHHDVHSNEVPEMLDGRERIENVCKIAAYIDAARLVQLLPASVRYRVKGVRWAAPLHYWTLGAGELQVCRPNRGLPMDKYCRKPWLSPTCQLMLVQKLLVM